VAWDGKADAVTAAEAAVTPADRRAGCAAVPVREDAYLLPELKMLLATAAAVIDRHTDAAGRCRACARPWPCGPAQLADLCRAGRVLICQRRCRAGPAPAADSGRVRTCAAIHEDQAALAQRFAGVAIWFGRATLQWWALPSQARGHRLLTAPSAGELADVLDRTLHPPPRPQRSMAEDPGRHGPVHGRLRPQFPCRPGSTA